MTSESAWLNRRQLVAGLGLGVAASRLIGCRPKGAIPTQYAYDLAPFERNPSFSGGLAPAESITPEWAAASYNNFYEFGTDKGRVWERARSLRVRPWTVEIGGLCHRPRTFDLDALLALPAEERVYRHRCVEAWSMVVPWVGFPLRSLLEAVDPMGDARFVGFESMGDEAQMPGITEQPWYPWPYFEALRIEEAVHPLAFVATGIYGHPLPNQHGAPLRLVLPWKYGFKSLKSVVRIDLVAEQPGTFWNELVPEEYSFLGNVRPDVPHPRWSQQSERMIPSGERVPTRMYNGYADQVASLYST